MRNTKKGIFIILFLLIPICIIAGLMVFNSFSLKIIVKELLFNTAILFFVLVIINVINKEVVRKISALILLLSFNITLFIKIFTLVNFFNFIDNAVLYTVFETNANETNDFITSYFKWYYLPVSLVYLAILIYLILKDKQYFKIKQLYYIEIGILLCTAITYRFYERSLSLLVFTTYFEYKNFSKEVAQEISQKTSEYLTNVTNNDEEALYVVVIGESTTKRNMGLYDYYRDTNPNLNKIKSELYLFNDVISPNTHTILSLDKVLSMKDDSNPNHNKKGTVVQLANQAGFDTYWLSNQNPIGANESLISMYAKASENQMFVSNLSKNNNKFDEVMLPYLDEIFKDKSSKKMIFIHLQGCHISYNKNYPEQFNYFTDQPKTQFKSNEAYEIINAYDNAVRYNDYVVSEIINKVKKQNKNSYVVYFSDHGEEVFQDFEYFGHHEGIGSKSMYEIPFIVWTSDKYNVKSQISFNDKLKRKYNLEDFIFSFSELSRINFDQNQSHKSIFSKDFKYKKRLIATGENYDDRK